MEMIGKRFEIKNDEYGPPKQYLGADVELFQLPDGSTAWSLLSTSYVRAAVDTIKRLLAEERRDLKSGKRPHKGQLAPGYKPELDVIDKRCTEHVLRYQQLIGGSCTGLLSSAGSTSMWRCNYVTVPRIAKARPP